MGTPGGVPDPAHPGQMTYPYSARLSPYHTQIEGYDIYGKPIFKPISPYDDKPAAPVSSRYDRTALDHGSHVLPPRPQHSDPVDTAQAHKAAH